MLTLPIKKKWFDMILSGEKKEEYRTINHYYTTRFEKLFGICAEDLIGGRFVAGPQELLLRNGYSADSPTACIHANLKIGNGKPEWGARENELYYKLIISEAFLVDLSLSAGIWEECSGGYCTPGGDPVYQCPVCKDRHVYGIENGPARSYCKVCKRKMLYSWQVKDEN